jgi:hypothetical protein
MVCRVTLIVGACALALVACGESDTPDASPYAAGGQDAAEVNAGDAAADAGGADGNGVSELDRITRAACEAASEGADDTFADGLPAGAAFASRAADGRVHVAWTGRDGIETRILRPAAMETEARRAVDRAVADFLRHNMRASDDRTGRTGAFRARDGRFCIIQTEDAVVAALRDAVASAPDTAGATGSSEG